MEIQWKSRLARVEHVKCIWCVTVFKKNGLEMLLTHVSSYFCERTETFFMINVNKQRKYEHFGAKFSFSHLIQLQHNKWFIDQSNSTGQIRICHHFRSSPVCFFDMIIRQQTTKTTSGFMHVFTFLATTSKFAILLGGTIKTNIHMCVFDTRQTLCCVRERVYC